LLITISGLPGSGTTTASRLVADALGLERVPGGEVFRQLAAEAGMTLADFGEHAQDHPEIDVELDHRLTERARAGGCVIESRLAGWLVTSAGLTAVRVWIDCSEEIRAARVAGRDGTSLDQALRDNSARAELEHARYLAAYDIDLKDRSAYDLVLESTDAPASELADEIIRAAVERFP
jgi:CMP/dCMP kinase